MLNISPIGRSCTPEERIEFSELDKVQGPDLGSPLAGFAQPQISGLMYSPIREGRSSFQLCICNKGETGLEARKPKGRHR